MRGEMKKKIESLAFSFISIILNDMQKTNEYKYTKQVYLNVIQIDTPKTKTKNAKQAHQ